VILLTGGTGFVGRHLLAQMARRGERVRVLDLRPLSPEASTESIETVVGDLRDETFVKHALEGVTAVIHLAAANPNPGTSAEDMRRANVEGTRTIARAAKSKDGLRFVHVSSAGVYGDSGEMTPLLETSPPAPATSYQRSKVEGEKALLEEFAGSAVSWTILRPCEVYGPGGMARLGFYRQVRQKRLWVYGPTTVTVHPTYVGDLVQALLGALDRLDRPEVHGQIFNVAGERPIAHFDFVRMVGDRLGVRVYRVGLPKVTAGIFGALAGLAGPRFDRLARRSISYAVDTTKARHSLGLVPKPLEAGLDETLDWVKREGLG
jgi:dihydroflavonol-4-reductase